MIIDMLLHFDLPAPIILPIPLRPGRDSFLIGSGTVHFVLSGTPPLGPGFLEVWDYSIIVGLQIAQSRSYLHTLGPKVGIIYIHGALGLSSDRMT